VNRKNAIIGGKKSMQPDEKPNPFPAADAEGCIARKIKRIGHLDIPGGAQVVSQNGILFVGHMSPPSGTTIIDVQDPKNPSILSTIELPDTQSHSHKVVVSGNLMLVNSQRYKRKFFYKCEALLKIEERFAREGGTPPSESEIAAELGVTEQDVGTLREAYRKGYQDGGFRIYDISSPATTREIGFQATSGMGAHGFDFDGKYAYVSTEMAGFRGNILVNYDLSNPERPQEVSRWWMPIQDDEGNGLTSPLGGNWLHHALRSGDMLWAACSHAGIWAIDISNIARPVTAGTYNYHPPFIESTHTVMALPQKYQGRDLALVIDEEHQNHPPGQPHAALWIFDVTDPGDMKPLSVFEVSELDSPWSRSGSRFGASQIVEHPTGDHVFAAWFAGGLRVIDISDPSAPTESAYFIPPPAADLPAPQSMDAEVDERGIAYLLDINRGLDILELNL